MNVYNSINIKREKFDKNIDIQSTKIKFKLRFNRLGWCWMQLSPMKNTLSKEGMYIALMKMNRGGWCM